MGHIVCARVQSQRASSFKFASLTPEKFSSVLTSTICFPMVSCILRFFLGLCISIHKDAWGDSESLKILIFKEQFLTFYAILTVLSQPWFLTIGFYITDSYIGDFNMV